MTLIAFMRFSRAAVPYKARYARQTLATHGKKLFRPNCNRDCDGSCDFLN
jgi:hypothetical protein